MPSRFVIDYQDYIVLVDAGNSSNENKIYWQADHHQDTFWVTIHGAVVIGMLKKPW
jgi:hypothetical protein